MGFHHQLLLLRHIQTDVYVELAWLARFVTFDKAQDRLRNEFDIRVVQRTDF